MRRHGPTSKIDLDQLYVLWRKGVPTAEIAATFGVHRDSVTRAANGIGLPSRPRGTPGHVKTMERARKAPRRIAAPKAEPATQPPLTGIAATGGRYADLAAYADAQGITLMRAQQEWHRHRAGV